MLSSLFRIFLNYPDGCFILVKNIAEPTNSDFG